MNCTRGTHGCLVLDWTGNIFFVFNISGMGGVTAAWLDRSFEKVENFYTGNRTYFSHS